MSTSDQVEIINRSSNSFVRIMFRVLQSYPDVNSLNLEFLHFLFDDFHFVKKLEVTGDSR